MNIRISLMERVAVEANGALLDEHRFPGRQGRILFAYLAAQQGRPVPRDELAELLWGDDLPATWEKALRVLMTKLRALLEECGIDGSTALTSAFGCYKLALPAGVWIDVDAAAEAVERAEAALAAGDLGEARSQGSTAAALARRSFLPGEHGLWVEEKRRDLRDVLVRALECMRDAAVGAGELAEAVRYADEVTELEPFRESGYRRLMEIHSAAGNPAEALRVYERCRRVLADELGSYPSPETEAIYRDLLLVPSRARAGPETDHSLVEREPGRRRRMAAATAAALLLLLAAAGAAVFALTRDSATAGLASVDPNSLAQIDASSGAVVAAVPVGARPAGVSAAGSTIWVENEEDRTVSRVDAGTHRVLRTLSVGEATGAVLASAGRVWLSTRAGALRRVDPAFHTLIGVSRVDSPSVALGSEPRELAAAYDSIWMTSSLGLLSRIDPQSGRVQDTIEVGEGASGIAAGADSLWVANTIDGTVSRIDRTGRLLATIPVGHGPTGVAFSAGAAWVTNGLDGTLVRIDPTTNAPVATVPVGSSAAGVAAGVGSVWVAASGDGTVVEVDAATNRIKRRVAVGARPVGVATGGGSVWVTVQQQPDPVGRAGGTVHLTAEADPGTLDPAVTYDLVGYQLLYATCAKLVTYPDAAAPAGAVLVPEVAESMPRISDDGRTYTFTVRRGFRFSPPSGQPVTAATFKRSFERVLAPATRSPVAGFLDDVVGARAFRSGRAAHVSGIVARGDTLTIRLVAPRGDLTSRLAMPSFCAVPAHTPVDPSGVARIPSAGPYYVASATAGSSLVLRRNPYYTGRRPHRLERIEVRIGVSKAAGLKAVLDGRSDWPLDGVPTGERARVAARYRGAGRVARAFVNPALTVQFVALNHSRPPFDDPRVRRAVSRAIDRAALVDLHRRFSEWGPLGGGKVNDQYLPPGMPGHLSTPLYRPRPDLQAARRLARGGRRQATMIVCNRAPCPQIGAIVKRNLAAIGIDVAVRELPFSLTYGHAAMKRPDWDLLSFGFAADYVDPGSFLNIFAGSGTSVGADPPLGLKPLPAVARMLHRAARLTGPARTRTYTAAARSLARDAVPAVAFATDESLDLFASRIGCQTYNPVYGIDLAALCVVEPGTH